MPVRVQGWFRFTKSTLKTSGGKPVAVCFSMRRVARAPGDYLFRCKDCGWRFESDDKLPLEVRLHLQLHFPHNRWKARYATVPPDGVHCPQCGFDQTSWQIIGEQEEAE